jgi:hypothetical protein
MILLVLAALGLWPALTPLNLALDSLSDKRGAFLAFPQDMLDALERPGREAGLHIL